MLLVPLPTKAELALARETVRNTMMEYVKEARAFPRGGAEDGTDQIQPETHHVAARWLNLEGRGVSWYGAIQNVQRIKCKLCGSDVR